MPTYSLCLALWAERIQAQGTFQNLGFEAARIVQVPIDQGPYYRSAIAASNALPGGTTFFPWVLYNSRFLDLAGLSVYDENNQHPQVLFGNYSVGFHRGFDGFVPWIAQEGTVPQDTRSILFLTDRSVPSVNVSFEGREVGLSLRGVSAGYRYVWAGDFTPFAGQNGELRFFGDGVLDAIMFSNQEIPEPGTILILQGWRGAATKSQPSAVFRSEGGSYTSKKVQEALDDE